MPPVVLDSITFKNLFDVWRHPLEGFVTDDFRDGFPDHILRVPSKHRRIRFADEAITQISPTAREHERRLIQHSF